MKSLRKLFPYIVLNIVISAATTLVVLWLWDFIIHPQITANSNPPSTTEISAPTTTVLVDTDEGNATQDQPTVIIENVFGVGDLETEVVVLKQVGEGKQTLTDWELKDQDGHSFRFPQLSLNKNGSTQIFTKIGVNSVIKLYWGLETSIWETGEEVRLFNEKGKLQTTYTIP